MEAWATFILLLDSNRELNNYMQSSFLSSSTLYIKVVWHLSFLQLNMIFRGGSSSRLVLH